MRKWRVQLLVPRETKDFDAGIAGWSRGKLCSDNNILLQTRDVNPDQRVSYN